MLKFEEWHESQTIENLFINRNSNREIYFIEGIPVYLTEVVPYSFMKKPHNSVYIDIQLSEEQLLEFGADRENIIDVWYGEMNTVGFNCNENSYNSLKKAYEFIMLNKENFKRLGEKVWRNSFFDK